MKIKTIDVNAKEWFDRVNGNSYFSGTIIINYGMKDQTELTMPFQYGYGDMYMQIAREMLWQYTFTGKNKPEINQNYPLTMQCRANNIILRHNIQTGCKKKEVENV